MLPFQVTICGLDELACHCEAGVSHVLSILDPSWPEPAAFGAYDPHHRLELRFHDIIEPQPGWIAPQQADVERLLGFGRDMIAAGGAHLLVHCHAGVSRSTAAAVLLLVQARPGMPAEEAVRAVVELRPRAWPNLRIIEFGDALLGRGGEVVAATADHYRRALASDPGLAELMIDNGRGREVALTAPSAS